MKLLKHWKGRNSSFKKRIMILGLSLFAVCSTLFAQERVISGVVKDETGETLVGVNIILKGTTIGTTTNIDGTFSLRIPGEDAVLSAIYIGYKSVDIPVGDREYIDISLQKDIQEVDEVVVVGYGVQKKKLVTGATVQVKNEDFVRNNVTRIENALQGLTPGMSIVKRSGQPGSDFNITIRGLSSINGNDPLVLIDGVPGSMNTLNPSDVESVDVLKDAASAAIYGSRAANGVVLITTKKGKAGEAKVTYDAYYGISNPSKKVDLLNAKEYALIQNEANRNEKPKKAVPFSDEYINSLGEGTDWQEAITNQNAPSQSHYLGISGGTDKSTYSVSISYNSEEGIYDFEDKSLYERIGLRINTEHQLKDFLKVGENLTYTHRKSKALGTGNIYSNFLHDILGASPLIPVYDETTWDGFGRSEYNETQGNPVASMHYNYNGLTNWDDLVGNIYAEIEILPGLKFRSDFGATLGYSYYSSYRDTFTLTSETYNQPYPDYEQSMSRTFHYNFDNVLSWQKEFGKHHLMALVGMNAQDGTYYNMRSVREGFLSNSAPVLSNVMPDTLTSSYTIQGDFGEGDSRFSVFGRVSYDFDEKYMATISLRRDGSSRFGKNNRYGYFPALSAGWVISREDFLEDQAWLDFLKLRASWGQNGKEPAERYVYMARVGSGNTTTDNRNYSIGGVEQVGISPIIYANPDLKWEASEQINIGIDSRFLENFRFTFDWYQKSSKDWIMQATVPGISGIAGISGTTNPYINGGNVVNSGIEAELAFQKSLGKDFYLEAAANFAYNKNKVTEVPDSIIHGSTSVLFNGCDEFYRVQEGMPLGYFFGYQTDGVFQTQEEIDSYVNEEGALIQRTAKPGDIKRVDTNGDGNLTDADKVMLGDPNPDFIYGFRVSLNYKGIDFSMNVQGQGGNQIVQSYRAMEREYFNYNRELVDDRWQWNDLNSNFVVDPGEEIPGSMPRVTLSKESNQNWRKFSDLYIHDADYLRIKSINIGYDLCQSILKKSGIERFRIYVSATNLLTLTDYNGYDPEVGYGAGDAYASGIDMGFYPSPRTYLIGVNVTF
ncbi:MAG TPA: TonB-dependent receptor [Prolixibacteraceae bacterium]|nr:TonB-dependent receptor [Prolixibacteraceae bacterium]